MRRSMLGRSELASVFLALILVLILVVLVIVLIILVVLVVILIILVVVLVVVLILVLVILIILHHNTLLCHPFGMARIVCGLCAATIPTFSRYPSPTYVQHSTHL